MRERDDAVVVTRGDAEGARGGGADVVVDRRIDGRAHEWDEGAEDVEVVGVVDGPDEIFELLERQETIRLAARPVEVHLGRLLDVLLLRGVARERVERLFDLLALREELRFGVTAAGLDFGRGVAVGEGGVGDAGRAVTAAPTRRRRLRRHLAEPLRVGVLDRPVEQRLHALLRHVVEGQLVEERLGLVARRARRDGVILHVSHGPNALRGRERDGEEHGDEDHRRRTRPRSRGHHRHRARGVTRRAPRPARPQTRRRMSSTRDDKSGAKTDFASRTACRDDACFDQ